MEWVGAWEGWKGKVEWVGAWGQGRLAGGGRGAGRAAGEGDEGILGGKGGGRARRQGSIGGCRCGVWLSGWGE